MHPASIVAFHRCRDLATTKAFYIDVLELDVAFEAVDTIIFGTQTRGHFGFSVRDGAIEKEGPCLTFAFESRAGVDAMWDIIDAHNLDTTDGPPAFRPRYGAYSFCMPDPDGYCVSFMHLPNATL